MLTIDFIIQIYSNVDIFFLFVAIAEEFSSLSISASLSAGNKPSSYPRGIINPNYPGFQHLAHTLSEQFVDPHSNNQTESMSDSDFSEVDSDFPSEGHSIENNNNNNDEHIHGGNDDSNGNKIIDTDVKPLVHDNLSTVEEILRTVFESNSNHLSSVIEMFAEKEMASEQTEIDANDDCVNDVNACDLETYLEHYEDGGIHIEKVKQLSKMKQAPAPVVIEPDVIRKSSSSECGFDQTPADKPDILLDVTEDGTAVLNGEKEKEEPGSTWSITPVDIVGNFEQEVERELGLLVTGYRNASFTSVDCDAIDGSVSSSNKLAEEDAVLSSANDPIPIKNQIPTAIVKPKYQKSSFDDHLLPTVAHMSEDESAWYDKSASNGMTASTKAVAAEIPAHSKKIHLPEFDRKAKKHMKSMTATSATGATTAAAAAPALATSAHAINAETVVHTNQCVNEAGKMESNASDRKETVASAVTHRRSVDKKSGTKLAVVQPRKKERMDQATLMETILQMQIKKNAQLYRNKGNNTTTKPTTAISSRGPAPEIPQANRLNNNNNAINNNNHSSNSAAAVAAAAAAANIHNNNRVNRIKTERNHAKRDQKESSGKFPM